VAARWAAIMTAYTKRWRPQNTRRFLMLESRFGAIDAVIIAGNALKDCVHCLRSFWEQFTPPTIQWPHAIEMLAAWQRCTSPAMAIAFGQPFLFSAHSLTWYKRL